MTRLEIFRRVLWSNNNNELQPSDQKNKDFIEADIEQIEKLIDDARNSGLEDGFTSGFSAGLKKAEECMMLGK